MVSGIRGFLATFTRNAGPHVGVPFSNRAEPEDAAPVKWGLLPAQAAVAALDGASRFQAVEAVDGGVFDH
jgi:hypothetical protein